MAHLDGDRSLLEEILQLFREDSPVLLDRLGVAISSRDAELLGSTAHTLKGAISNFAAGRAFELAQGLESIGTSGDFAAARTTHEKLVAELERLDRDLASFLASSE